MTRHIGHVCLSSCYIDPEVVACWIERYEYVVDANYQEDLNPLYQKKKSKKKQKRGI